MTRAALDFLKKLLDTPSPAGFEHQGQRVWLDYAASFADETFTDTYGNAVAALNPAGSPKVMIVGHADEVGLMVQHIDEDGFVYAASIGGVDPATMAGKRFVIHAKKGPVLAVTGTTAIHLQEKKTNRLVGKLHEFFLDIGARSQTEARRRVAVGDPITAAEGFQKLNGNLAVARAFDNRVGTWAAAETLRLIKTGKRKPQAAVFAVSAVREETGAKASQLIARKLDADIALIIDVGHATDTPGIDQRRHGKVVLGGGPALSVGGPVLLEMYERLAATAHREKITVQTEISPNKSATDADAVFVATTGIATGLVSLPLRYMHTTVEMADLRDLEAIPKLFASFCTALKKGEKIRARI